MKTSQTSHVLSPLAHAQAQIRATEKYLNVHGENTDLFEILSTPERILEVHIPVRMDNGEMRLFTGYRSQHSSVRGPYKWGIRFHPQVSRDEVQALSMWMSIKCAVLDLPLGWGKWGVIVDPKSLSKRELELLSRGYVQALFKNLWPTQDIPAPDINTTPEIMAWMMDEYSRLAWVYAPGAFTGKPLAAGGSLGRGEATAQGGLFVLDTYLANQGTDLRGKTVIIQWAGNAGLTMAKLLKDTGAHLIGISDSGTALYDRAELPIEAILEWKQAKRSFDQASFGKQMTNAELLVQECDILIPAALENQITMENAGHIQAGLVLELANGPTVPEADALLFAKWIPVIPDILANAWGVTVSYFEQVQNNANYYWDAQEVRMKLETKMCHAASAVFWAAKAHDVSFRQWAYIIALSRIIDAMRARGNL